MESRICDIGSWNKHSFPHPLKTVVGMSCPTLNTPENIGRQAFTNNRVFVTLRFGGGSSTPTSANLLVTGRRITKSRYFQAKGIMGCSHIEKNEQNAASISLALKVLWRRFVIH